MKEHPFHFVRIFIAFVIFLVILGIVDLLTPLEILKDWN